MVMQIMILIVRFFWETPLRARMVAGGLNWAEERGQKRNQKNIFAL
jgi:hypothetical protein